MSVNPFEIIETLAQAHEWLEFGCIKPRGWMREQMKHDMEDGFLGKLNQLVPELVEEDDIYGRDRLTKEVKSKHLGNDSDDKEWEIQYLWWNSETQSNWRDGYLRTAILLEDQSLLQEVAQYIARILSYQDKDGYLGIYGRDLRFNFDTENGELWAQASLLRGLLAYFEATREQAVLEAIIRAVRLTMETYPPHQSNPFGVTKSFAGVGHGLMFTDIVDRLYQITGDRSYLEYGLWLYENYSANDLSEQDIRYENVIDSAYKLKGHGVHTYEHIRALTTAYYASGNGLLKKALEDYLAKVANCIMPSGGPVGDEWVGERASDATETGYEYCSLQELLDSYTHLLQKTGDLKWADKVEWILFNAAQGARHPEESSIAYLKTDNSYSMVGKFRPDDTYEEGKVAQVRYKYSPTHQDAAVCCNPNAGRIYPYYVKSMWLKNEQGLTATLYGASVVTTEIQGAQVTIEQQTNYPFELDIHFKILIDQPRAFELRFRQPSWAKDNGVPLQASGANISREGGGWIAHKYWQNGDKISLRFEAAIQLHQDRRQDYYFTYGPLLYALPIEAQRQVNKSHVVAGFHDLYYTSEQSHDFYLDSNQAQNFQLKYNEIDGKAPWKKPASGLQGVLWNAQTQQNEMVELWPIGSTILRRTTFSTKPT